MTDSIRLFDSHCHIDFSHFDDDRDAMFERMAAVGVEGCVVVGVDFGHIDSLRELAQARDNVWFSVGIHPNHEVEVEPTIEQLCELADHPRCVAIGETGMDFFRHHVDPDIQENRFRTHIRAAKMLNKPVIVHNRDADEASIQILRDEQISKCGGIMHCFSADMATADAAIELGMHISFSGNVTFKRNEELREVAANVPAELLLVETDSPYLAPMPFRGKRNEPAFVKQVAECIAEVRGRPLSELAAQTTANTRRIFNISN
ncbi:TatD DNase family protein [Mariprofundus micogutta]|uniref:TatD DNase family protein n=1 Tax=Mariprofundus micogutta TaxID=1921010 RepID=A0A1L8CK79_9PROT|nr:TatD family hydrolase [Mariprofundus micogutta]GAV19312.1 TatD DNase family protein [Mariprofundus micogutta]